jgi:F-type H+-transporting ATPase subunit b
MPQMEFADYVPQLVWLAITFTVFYFVMARVALPRIAEAIESRQERVAGDLETATRMREEAEEALVAYEATVAKARAEAQAIAAKAREEIAAEAAERQAAFEAELDARAVVEDARIAEAVAEVRKGLRDVAVAAAQAATAKLVGGDVPQDALNKAVDAEMEARA